jgi:protein SCO1/2
MLSISTIRTALIVLVLASAALAQPFRGQMGSLSSPPTDKRPPMLKQVGIEQHLDGQIPPGLAFRDESGKAVHLGDYFGKKPAILNLVYYQCPMLCGEVLSGMTSSLGMVNFDIGKEFDVITVSIDPREGPDLAIEKKNTFIQRYRRAGAEKGWHFLTGNQENITALAKAAGFGYEYDEATGQFAHATAIMVLTPEGKISRYLYGVEYPPKDVRLALVEASQHKIGGVVDQILLYCYHYNPATGKYGAIIANVLRIAGGVTVLIIGTFMFVMLRRDAVAKHSETERVA